jgi:hypothetical protein
MIIMLKVDIDFIGEVYEGEFEVEGEGATDGEIQEMLKSIIVDGLTIDWERVVD